MHQHYRNATRRQCSLLSRDAFSISVTEHCACGKHSMLRAHRKQNSAVWLTSVLVVAGRIQSMQVATTDNLGYPPLGHRAQATLWSVEAFPYKKGSLNTHIKLAKQTTAYEKALTWGCTKHFSTQNSTASLRHLSASERLSYLHWLPVNHRIQFIIATLTYKTLATCQPSYLHNLLQVYQPSRALHSSTQQLLPVPYMSTNFGRRTYSYSSPATRNSIPISIKNCSSLYSSKRHLKSYFIAQLIKLRLAT